MKSQKFQHKYVLQKNKRCTPVTGVVKSTKYVPDTFTHMELKFYGEPHPCVAHYFLWGYTIIEMDTFVNSASVVYYLPKNITESNTA